MIFSQLSVFHLNVLYMFTYGISVQSLPIITCAQWNQDSWQIIEIR